MKFSLKVIILILVFSQSLSSQTGNFSSNLSSISSQLKKVENTKASFDQKIISENLGIAVYTLVETSKKGKIKKTSYEFNFADIDANTVRYKTSKDIIKVQLLVKQNQRMIKKIIDDKKITYEKEIYFIAENIDNARNLVENIKNAIPVANKITESKLSLQGYEDRLTWLKKNIQNVSSVDVEYIQKLTIDNSYPASVFFSKIENKKKSATKELYGFNLGNINPNSVQFKNKGSNLIIQVKTKRKLKTIKLTRDGEQKNYLNSLEIICKNIENAREIQKVLQDIVPLAEERFKRSIQKTSSITAGLSSVNKKIAKVISARQTTLQNFEGTCIVSLNQVEKNDKKKTDNTYDFNFKDINKQDIDIKISGKNVYLTIKTIAKDKFIRLTKNGELQNYVYSMKLMCNSVEDAVINKQILQDITEICNQKILNFSKSFSELQSEIKKVVEGSTTYNQNIEKLPSGFVKLTVIKASNKKSEENIQEFKMTDVNPKSVKMKVSGKKVMVEFYTNYQEKIIKTYKNGEIKGYTNKVVIYCNSIENARKTSEIIKVNSNK